MKKATLLVILAVAAIVVLLAARAYFTEADFGPTNPYWNGLAGLSGKVGSLYSISELAGADPHGTLLIVGPAEAFTEPESAQVLAFLNSGGRVVVLDDYGSSNSLLTGLGSPITLYQQPLCQFDDYYLSHSFPVITVTGNHSFLTGAGKLVLNHPVSLQVEEGKAELLATTSDQAWIDLNDDGFIDDEEAFGRYPVMAAVKYGEGELIVGGDPDLAINAMKAQGDNAVLQANILGQGPVYLDVAHGPGSALLPRTIHAVQTDPAAQLLCVLLVSLAGYVLHRVNLAARSRRRPPEDPMANEQKQKL